MQKADKYFKQTVEQEKGLSMYNYMVFNVGDKKFYRDFMSYYKRNECDDLYFVSINHPDFIKYLEEFIERRTN